MSKQTLTAHRSQIRTPQVPIAPAELRRLRSRLHTGEHVVLNQQDVTTILQILAVLAPAETSAPGAHRVKPIYQRQRHRPVRNHRT